MESKMFCFQCQETVKNQGCTFKGMCGKESSTANLQDLLIFNLKEISIIIENEEKEDLYTTEIGQFVAESLFKTITNANFDNNIFISEIKKAEKIKEALLSSENKSKYLFFESEEEISLTAESGKYGVLKTQNTDIRSLRELIVYGLKGMAAYSNHAHTLGAKTDNIYKFIISALAKTLDESLSIDDLIALVMETGNQGVQAMAALDEANTTNYGHPEITNVNLGPRGNPGILISGHDLKDLEELLIQTQDSDVDVYTHSEMLPAHAYPYFKKFKNFAGNYGNAWWLQNKEFISFNGPVLFTTNCITPPKTEYIDRIFTTGNAGYPGCTHIPERAGDKAKDFSPIIEKAKECSAPVALEKGTITTGFARNQVMSLADKVIDAVKTGAIKRFVVMAGCDGRHKTRSYYTDVAENLPKDTVILTAGCAKYRYNKLNLGDIGGIPRVLDAGQCNDSYSLAYIAMQLQKAFELDDINDLPISYDIAWYEQKAVIVLLALLSLGVKGIRLGPTLPAFLSPAVVDVLVKNFDIKPITDSASDIKAMMEGR